MDAERKHLVILIEPVYVMLRMANGQVLPLHRGWVEFLQEGLQTTCVEEALHHRQLVGLETLEFKYRLGKVT